MGNSIATLPTNKVDPRMAMLFGIDPVTGLQTGTAQPGAVAPGQSQSPAGPQTAGSAPVATGQAQAPNAPQPTGPATPGGSPAGAGGFAKATQAINPTAAPAPLQAPITATPSATSTPAGDPQSSAPSIAALPQNTDSRMAPLVDQARQLPPPGTLASGFPEEARTITPATPQQELSSESFLKMFPGGNVPIEKPAILTPRHGAGRFAHDVALVAASVMNPFAAPFILSSALDEPRVRQQVQSEQDARQFQANQAAYKEYLAGQTEQAKAGELQAATGAEQAQAGEAKARTGQIQWEQGQELATAKAGAIADIQKMKASGDWSDGPLEQSWLRRIAANPHLGLTPQDVHAIIAEQPVLGPKFDVVLGQSGAPEALKDRQGNVYSASQIPEDPQARTMWKAAMDAHQQSIVERVNDENRQLAKSLEVQKQANQDMLSRMGVQQQYKQAQDLNGQLFKSWSTVSQAQSTLELARQYAAQKNSAGDAFLTYMAAGEERPTGTTRLTPTEVGQVKGLGNFTQKAIAEIENWTTGTTFSDETRSQLVDAMARKADSVVKGAMADMDNARKIYSSALMPPAPGSAVPAGAPGAAPAPGAASKGAAAPSVDPGQAAAAHASKTASDDLVRGYAREHGLSYGAALDAFTSQGYRVIPKGAQKPAAQ